jgi:hypothetical protein
MIINFFPIIRHLCGGLVCHLHSGHFGGRIRCRNVALRPISTIVLINDGLIGDVKGWSDSLAITREVGAVQQAVNKKVKIGRQE